LVGSGKKYPEHIIIKTLNIQNKKILKVAKDKQQVTYKGKPIKIKADFSIQMLHTRKSWKDVFQILKENNYQHKSFYSAKQFFLSKEK
jgi:hypothetical protein